MLTLLLAASFASAPLPTLRPVAPIAPLAVPGAPASFKLANVDPAWTGGVTRARAERRFEKAQQRLEELQRVFYADGQSKLLLVFQAMDTAGKDGVIRGVVGAFDPQGVSVTSFKKPTPEEASQHYLERVNKTLSVKGGHIVVHNRSAYEDILVPTVYGTLPKAEIEKRYAEINAWEKRLSDEGWTILKFFLHISKDEQKRRLQARLDDPNKNWKFSMADLETRKAWNKFQRTYEKILKRTSTAHAPWHVIPADHKWYRDYAVARVIKRALKDMKLKYPPPAPGLEDVVID